MPTQRVVLCEGYHDRAFWSGMLEHLGCKNPGRGAADPWGRPVVGGEFAFLSRSDHFIRVVPCRGKSGVLEGLRLYLKDLTYPTSDLAANFDPDVAAGLGPDDLLRETRAFYGDARLDADGVVVADVGRLRAMVIRWETDTPSDRGVPARGQTLERIVCQALASTHPDRADAVDRWLASRPSPPPPNPKEHAWSYMAGWDAEKGCEYFYSALWEQPAVTTELERLLSRSGTWSMVQDLAR